MSIAHRLVTLTIEGTGPLGELAKDLEEMLEALHTYMEDGIVEDTLKDDGEMDLADDNSGHIIVFRIEEEPTLRYIPVSPDGYSVTRDPDDNKDTEAEAIAFAQDIIRARYTAQGYYSLANRERISIEEACDRCYAISYNATDEEE